MTQMSIFDLPTGIELANKGIALAADNKGELVTRGRNIALRIAATRGEVTADDVQYELAKEGVSVKALGNAAGAIFRDRRFKFTGRMAKSTRIHAHGNLLRVWELAR
jgi:hypothetical protein